MTNVNVLVPPEGIFADICRVIPDPLKSPSNENKIYAAWHKLRVRGGPRQELFHDVAGLAFRFLALRAMVTHWSAIRSRFAPIFMAEITSLISDATGVNRSNKLTPS
jgi:hypothetical protein